MITYIIWACGLGALSAVSLPLGSWIGLQFKFKPSQLSIMAAFGAGALLAALSIELIAPTTLKIMATEGSALVEAKSEFYLMIIGCVIGGLIYVLLDYLVNINGGFARKTATLYSHYKKESIAQQNQTLDRLSKIRPFELLPPEYTSQLLQMLEIVKFKKGDRAGIEGEPTEACYIVLEGSLRADIGGVKVDSITTEHGILNLVSMITNSPVMGTSFANEDVTALRLSKSNFELLCSQFPKFKIACQEISNEKIEYFQHWVTNQDKQIVKWAEESKSHTLNATPLSQIPLLGGKNKEEEHHGSPIAIWLGILIDGIPESLVIGAGMLGMLSAKLASETEVSFSMVIPFTLIAGLFLSNFPEALSSSANMLAQGWKKPKIFLMWFSLMVITALGAGFGFFIADIIDSSWIIFLQGLASGAMLTMIAAAMIPEAVLLGRSNVVGLSTLAGFLAAILFKVFE